MITRPPRSTRPDTLFPSTTLVRSGQDKGTGPTSCTDLAVRQLLVGQDLARGPADLAPGAAVAHDDVAGSLGRGRRGLGADHVLGESQVPHPAPGHLVARAGLGSRQVPRARPVALVECCDPPHPFGQLGREGWLAALGVAPPASLLVPHTGPARKSAASGNIVAGR